MTEFEKLFQAIDAHAEEYLHVWEDICNIESPTNFKEGVDRVGEYCAEKARKMGFEITVFEQNVSGNVVMIVMNPDAKEAPICFSGHMDTVHPVGSFGTPAAHIEGERLYGPGAIDCKGGIVSAMLAMHALKDVGFCTRPIKLFLQSDEEVSSITSGKETIRWICKNAKGSVAFLNGESKTDNYVALSRKGILRYRFEVVGRATHSSSCYNGVSAICEASHKIIELEKMKDRNGGVTCNCGLISGGTAENTVAENCTFYADIRYPDTESRRIAEETVKRVSETSYVEGSSCTVTLKSERICMEYTERNVQLLSRMNEIYERAGLPVLVGRSASGGSDAADVTAYGIPCVDNMGASGFGLHSVGEYGSIASLAESAKYLAAAALKL